MLYDPGETTSFRASDGNMVKIEYYRELPSTAALAKSYAESGKPDRYRAIGYYFKNRYKRKKCSGTC